MEPAIRSIVDTYVRLRNRKALDELRAHRGRLITELKSLASGYDTSKPIAQIEAEIAVIEAGLAKLNAAAAGPDHLEARGTSVLRQLLRWPDGREPRRS